MNTARSLFNSRILVVFLLMSQVENDFCAFFDFRDHPLGEEPPVPPMLTLKGFKDYYTDVGVCEPYDAVFIPMIEVGKGGSRLTRIRDKDVDVQTSRVKSTNKLPVILY